MTKKLLVIIKCIILCMITLDVNAIDLVPIKLSLEARFIRALENADIDSFVVEKGDTMYLSKEYKVSSFILINRGTVIIRDTATLSLGCSGKLLNDGSVLNNGTLNLGVEGKFGLPLFCTGEYPTIVNNGVMNNNGNYKILLDDAIVENNNLMKCTEAAHKHQTDSFCQFCHDDLREEQKQTMTFINLTNGGFLIKLSNGKKEIELTESDIKDELTEKKYSMLTGINLSDLTDDHFASLKGAICMNGLDLIYTQPEKDGFYKSTPKLVLDVPLCEILVIGKCSTNMPIVCNNNGEGLYLSSTYVSLGESQDAEKLFERWNTQYEKIDYGKEHKILYKSEGSFIIDNNTTNPAIEAKILTIDLSFDLKIKSEGPKAASIENIYNWTPELCRYKIEGIDYERSIVEKTFNCPNEIFVLDDKYDQNEVHIYTKEPLYEITYLDDNDNVLKVVKSKFRELSTNPDPEIDVEKEGYKFIAWEDVDNKVKSINVEDDITFKAMYESTGIEHLAAEMSTGIQKIYDEATKQIFILLPNGKKYGVMGVEVK